MPQPRLNSQCPSGWSSRKCPRFPDSLSSTCSNTQALSNKGFWETRCEFGLPRYPLLVYLISFFTVPFTVKEGSGEKAALRAQPQSPSTLQHSHTHKDSHVLGRLVLAAGSPKSTYGCCQALLNMAEYIAFVDIPALFLFNFRLLNCPVGSCNCVITVSSFIVWGDWVQSFGAFLGHACQTSKWP